jgi:alpha-glucosidase
MTAEGVRGDEESPKNEDVLKTLFTRCLAGAADQTGCYFTDRVNQMGSHASQLAKMVCIYSPWQSVFWYDRPAGSPGAGTGRVSVLQDVPELSFFERLPTVWDETRVLDGYPGTHAVIARRSGKSWFVGALNGVEARDFQIPLGFLADHTTYKLELFSDDPAFATPTHVRIETNSVDHTFLIKRRLASRSGLAAILTPVEGP